MNRISFGTLQLSIAPTVYEPAEDSFLLATYASSLSGGKKILEVGCGSGIVSLAAAHADASNSVLGVDLNPAAVKCAAENAKENGIKNAEFAESDLFAAVPSGSKFDAILFNPPYLPTTREEKLALEEENLAYDGGESGLETFCKFATQVSNYLAANGKAAIIATSLSDGIKKSLAELEQQVGTVQILAEEKFFFEKIALIEATKR
ncbi:MAG: methyltransferase [Candidatus Anstonellaceae archaeon]